MESLDRRGFLAQEVVQGVGFVTCRALDPRDGEKAMRGALVGYEDFIQGRHGEKSALPRRGGRGGGCHSITCTVTGTALSLLPSLRVNTRAVGRGACTASRAVPWFRLALPAEVCVCL